VLWISLTQSSCWSMNQAESADEVVALPPEFLIKAEHRSLAAYSALVGGESDA
jgi:hypothetical protein